MGNWIQSELGGNMKKIIFSVYTKIAISILCIVSILCAFSVGIDGIKQWDDYKSEVYLFENEFEESYFLSNVLNFSSYDIYNTAMKYINNNTYDIKEYLSNNIDDNHMDYYLILDNKEFTNNQDGHRNHTYYNIILIENNEIITYDSYPYDNYYHINPQDTNGHKIEVYVGLNEPYINTIHNLWTEQKALVNGTFIQVTYWLLAFIFGFIYLLFTVGKDSVHNKITHTVDHLFIECNIAIIAGTITASLLTILAMINQYCYGDFPFELLKLYSNILVGFATSIVLVLLLSIIRNIKNKTFASRCILLIILRKILKIAQNIINDTIQLANSRISQIVIIILFLYTAVIGIFGYKSYNYGMIYWCFGVVLFVILAYISSKYLISLNKIKVGVQKIKNGELDYKIEKLCFLDLNLLKDGINDISNGLQASVNKTLKAERLKTELITNVSHDLKTPLTSIISYTQLLSNVENLPEEAKDYITIIDKKSQRLKALTQDLFDISKVQSGNDEIVLEKLNVETLLSQSLAEHEKELENLTICTNIEAGLYFFSDGRKMSRVINNLLINISKYSLPQTRVFINAYSNNDKVFIEMKNISSYPLDFDTEEIMQRFKRADESRTEEGNGLGLAIVKSYVEVTGGKFDIILDGDMFKAIIEYDRQ